MIRDLYLDSRIAGMAKKARMAIQRMLEIVLCTYGFSSAVNRPASRNVMMIVSQARLWSSAIYIIDWLDIVSLSGRACIVAARASCNFLQK